LTTAACGQATDRQRDDDDAGAASDAGKMTDRQYVRMQATHGGRRCSSSPPSTRSFIDVINAVRRWPGLAALQRRRLAAVPAAADNDDDDDGNENEAGPGMRVIRANVNGALRAADDETTVDAIYRSPAVITATSKTPNDFTLRCSDSRGVEATKYLPRGNDTSFIG
jgi:hypothetical protein